MISYSKILNCMTNVKNIIKDKIKRVFCSQVFWWIIVAIVIFTNPSIIIRKYISQDWYLWLMLIFSALLAWIIFKASHQCKKTSMADIAKMGFLYCLVWFLCITSPFANSYPAESIKHLLDCLAALGPLIVGFATVFVACMQWNITNKQHNLALLEKRLALKNKFENYVDDKLRNCVTPALNFEILYETYDNLTNISGDAYLLFSQSISDKIMNIAKDFETLKSAVHYAKNRIDGNSAGFYNEYEDTKPDISTCYGQIVQEKNLLVAEMHLMMREKQIQ